MTLSEIGYLAAIYPAVWGLGQLGTGGCLEPATMYLNILETRGESRHNH